MLATGQHMDATPTLTRVAPEAHTLATHTTAQTRHKPSGQPCSDLPKQHASVCRAHWQPINQPARAAPHETAPARGRRVLRHARPLPAAPGRRLHYLNLEAQRVPPPKTVRLAKASACFVLAPTRTVMAPPMTPTTAPELPTVYPPARRASPVPDPHAQPWSAVQWCHLHQPAPPAAALSRRTSSASTMETEKSLSQTRLLARLRPPLTVPRGTRTLRPATHPGTISRDVFTPARAIRQ